MSVPEREVLIVLKLHSGRLTDFRDVVAIGRNLDINLVSRILFRGKISVIKKNIKRLLALIDKKEFIDSFKGVFIEKKYDVDLKSIKKLKRFA